MQKVGESEFKAEVLESGLPVVVDFFTEWCAPCKAIAPALEELSETHVGKVRFVKVDIDDEPTLAESCGVRSVPTLMVFKDGKVVDQRTGGASKSALAAWVQRHA